MTTTGPVPCQVCRHDQTTDPAPICWPCTHALRATLRGVPDLLTMLVDATARRTSIDRPGYTSGDEGRTLDHRYPGTAATTTLPYDVGASDAAAAIRKAVVDAARALAVHVRPATASAGRNWPDRPHQPATAPSAAAWLLTHAPLLRHQAWAPDAHRAITRAVKHGAALIDLPPESITLGTCDRQITDPQLGGIVLCGHELRAHPGDTVLRCRGCGHQHDVTARRDQMLAGSDERLVTTFVVTRALNVPGATLRSWRRRGQVAPAADTADGEPLWRLGDIRQLRHREAYGIKGT
jgi:hypothetical protein